MSSPSPLFLGRPFGLNRLGPEPDTVEDELTPISIYA